MSLLALQTEFQSWLLGAPSAPERHLTGHDGITPAIRLAVYHHAYRARLGDVLREAYDKTWTYVGDDAFNAAIDRCIAARPSTSRSLDDYGGALLPILAELHPDEPDVLDLAWLDWAMRQVFSGPNAAPVGIERLSALTPGQWETVVFTLHPTLKLRPVESNVGPLWAGLDSGDPPAPAPLPAPMGLRVWRKGLQPSFRMIEMDEYAALADPGGCIRFADLCESLVRNGTPDPVETAARMLGAWFEDELITGLDAG